MAVYIVTGKLGAGKTLAAVARIRDALARGAPVATNLDISLHKLVRVKSKKATIYRLPDKPTAEDMRLIGSGNDSYDETRNGLIVLDECGTWFNSRDWQDKGRRALIDWLLHARKLGWDIILIIQDITLIDKQARKSVAEHVVYCRRLDRAIKIPILDWVARLATDKPIPKPKIHVGVVRYGDQPTSMIADRWWYKGDDLYQAYNTKQVYTDDYPHGLYQVLPPYYSHGRYQVKRDSRFLMRMTKIYFRRFSKVGVLALGIVAGSAIASYMNTRPDPAPDNQVIEETPPPEHQNYQPEPQTEAEQEVLTLRSRFDGYTVTGVASGPDGEPVYVQIGNGQNRYGLDSLRATGYVVRMVNQCEVLIMTPDRSDTVRLFTTYCPTHDGNVNPPRMTPEERYRYRLAQLQAEQQSSQ